MNTGVIASRYADALLKYVEKTGEGGTVFSQAGIICDKLRTSGGFSRFLESKTLFSTSEKLGLIRKALGNEELCPSLARFLKLVFRQGRVSYLRYMLYYFRERWRDAQGMKPAKLTVSAPSPELEARLERISKEVSGKELDMETVVDPSLIGGFVFEVDDCRIDASVSRQLSELKRQFVSKNRRLV